MSSVEIILTVLGAAGGTGVIMAGLSAWLGKVWADRIAQAQKLAGDIDLDLRKRRIDLYEELKTWYFQRGGMYLSRTAHRDAYSPLQDTLANILGTQSTGPISDQHYELVRDRCSALRTALANDIESRREGPI